MLHRDSWCRWPPDSLKKSAGCVCSPLFRRCCLSAAQVLLEELPGEEIAKLAPELVVQLAGSIVERLESCVAGVRKATIDTVKEIDSGSTADQILQ